MNSSPTQKDSANDSTGEEEDGVPAPPKPPRSAFMCFTDTKRNEIIDRYKVKKDKDILKLVADEWKRLSDRERAHWDEEARNDKLRFVREKAEYKGPWNLPKRRAKKHPLAPKRPMSAFLSFSQKRRSTVSERNPAMSNTDVSRLLGEMWRNASPAERAPYVEQEQRERAEYKEQMKQFKERLAKMDAASRTSHQIMQQLPARASSKKSLPLRENQGLDGNRFAKDRPHSKEDGSRFIDRRIFRSYSDEHADGPSRAEQPTFYQYQGPTYTEATPMHRDAAVFRSHPEDRAKTDPDSQRSYNHYQYHRLQDHQPYRPMHGSGATDGDTLLPYRQQRPHSQYYSDSRYFYP